MNAARQYLATLAERFGQGWNRFWFAPSNPFTLSVLRLLTGTVAFYVVLTYGFDYALFFGPDGLLPPRMVGSFIGNSQSFSLLYLFDTPGKFWAFQTVALMVLAMFAAGFYSRVTAVLSLVVVLSYFHRAPMLTAQMEAVLSMLLFYLCLGPCGAYLSVDRWLKLRRAQAAGPAVLAAYEERTGRSSAATIAVRLVQLHLALLYLLAGASKLLGESWWTGMSAWWLIARLETSPFDLTWLHAHPYFVNFWTYSIVLFELVFPILVWNRLARPLLVTLAPFVLFSIAVLTGLYTFALLMVIANLSYLPPQYLRQACGALTGKRTADADASVPAKDSTEAATDQKVRVAG